MMQEQRDKTADLLLPLVLLAGAIAVSFLASSGPIQWMDNGQFLADASQGRFFSESLGPLDHPLYQTVITLMFEAFGPRALSLLNSILLLPLAWLVYRVAIDTGLTRRPALIACGAAILAHGVFWVSTKAEVYLLHTVLVLAAYWVHFDPRQRGRPLRRMFLIGVFTGMAAAVHQLTFVVLLPLYLQMLMDKRSRVLITVPGFALGLFAAWPAILHDLHTGFSPFEIVHRYLTGDPERAKDVGWQGSLFRIDEMWHEKNAIMLLVLSLIGPQLVGLLLRPENPRLRLLWWGGVLNLVFAATYNVMDRFTFFLPGVVLLAIVGVAQLDALLPNNRVWRTANSLSVLSAPLVLLLMFGLYAQGVVKLPVHKESLPFRDDIHYFMAPYLQDRSAEQFVRSYEHSIPEGALIIADWTPLGALRSAQASGSLGGRTIGQCEELQDFDVNAFLASSGVYLARTSYCAMVVDQFALTSLNVGFALRAR